MNEDTIGNRLKSARKKMGMSVDQVYVDLKIHPDILRALEEDKIDPKIGDIYLKGFLKKYADFLGFDGEEIASEFIDRESREREKWNNFVDVPSQDGHPPPILKDRFERSLPVTTAIAVVLVIALIVYAGSKFIGGLRELGSRPPKASSEPPPKKEVAKTGEPATAKPKIDRPKAKRPAPPVKKKFIVSRRSPLLLKAETKDKVWLRVKSDGEVIFENTLSKNSVMTWEAKDELELWVGRGDALDLTLNDNHLGSPGRGRIRRVIINREGMKVHKK